MIFRQVNRVAFRTSSILLAVATLLVTISAAPLYAQNDQKRATGSAAQQATFEQLTKENLIGKAVSLSNNDYAEIDKAIQRFRNGDSASALEFLKTAKDKYPKLPPAEIIFAKMHFAIRNTNAVKAGLVLLERSVVENPDDPEAYLLLADQAFVGRRVTEAHALFELVSPIVEAFDENAKRKQDFMIRLLAGRAAVAESRKQWEEAGKWLQQWVELAPESAAAHQRLGGTLFQLKKPKEALERFREARSLNPKVPHPYIAIGQLFSRGGDNENAQKAFDKAYTEDKNDATTAQAYAEWLIQQNKLDEAQIIAAAMLEQTPDSITALLLDGIVAQMQGQVDRAKQAMTKIISLDPSHFTATDLLALLLIQSDDVADQERALRYAQVNSRLFPDNPRSNITRAWILYRLGRTAEFQEALKKVGRSQVPLDSAYLIAKIMVEQGKKDAAIQELDKLVQKKAGMFVFRRQAEELLNQLKSE